MTVHYATALVYALLVVGTVLFFGLLLAPALVHWRCERRRRRRIGWYS